MDVLLHHLCEELSPVFCFERRILTVEHSYPRIIRSHQQSWLASWPTQSLEASHFASFRVLASRGLRFEGSPVVQRLGVKGSNVTCVCSCDRDIARRRKANGSDEMW